MGFTVVEVKVRGFKGEVLLKALVDTGFYGDLITLPKNIEGIGIELRYSRRRRLPNGEVIEVKFGGAEIQVMDSITYGDIEVWDELPDGSVKVLVQGYVNGGETYQITGTIGEPAGYRIFYLVDNYGNVLDSCRIDVEEMPPPIQAEVKFRGVATMDEAYGQFVCYGSYYCKVRVVPIERYKHLVIFEEECFKFIDWDNNNSY